MKISAVIVSRNDNYGGRLSDRATYCINSAIETYDEVFYIDWNSPSHSLFYDIKDNLKLKGNLNHIVVSNELASLLTGFDNNAQVCCETLARNIGIRRATGDWIVSTNIDIIHPIREELQNHLSKLDINTFYTISRRHTDWETIEKFHNGKILFSEWESLRKNLIENSEKRVFEEKTLDEDDYSLINCCGDYQVASKHIWNEIRGFEEELIYSLYTDTNVQKKAVMHGFGLKALYEPALFHIEHGRGGGGFLDGINRVTNNPQRAIIEQQKTRNLNSWGCVGIDFESEIF
jgi:hypothetical protein